MRDRSCPEIFGVNGRAHVTAKTSIHTWVFPKIGVPQNGWFIMENPIEMDDLGVPLFLETPIHTDFSPSSHQWFGFLCRWNPRPWRQQV